MLRRSLIAVAVCLYAVVVGCVLLRNDRSGARTNGTGNQASSTDPDADSGTVTGGGLPFAASREGLPYRCVGMQLQRVDWIDKYKKSIDRIVGVGADTVKFVVDARQENGRSTRIYLDMRMTPTTEQLTDLIQYAKSKKLRVILMPIVLLDKPLNDEWRGTIRPELWHDWFDSYREVLRHYAEIAQRTDVDLFVVGSELVSTETKRSEWSSTIAAVRGVYHGKLTYSSNWDHYTSVPFWDQLDLVGMNSYWSFGDEKNNPQPSVEEINERWKKIQSDLLPFLHKVNKPLIFLEIGWFSQANVAYEPWDYTQDKPVDLEMQRRLYEGFFESWHGNPSLGGFSVWEWPPGDGGPTDKGYTPQGKPAEKVLRDWLAKPRWDVK